MKYSEFKAEVEKLGYVVDDGSTPIYVDTIEDGETLMSIGKHKRLWLDPWWSGFIHLNEDQKLKLYDVAYQLAKTPLAEREEEKRYWLRKLPVPLLDRSEEKKWLWRQRGTDIVGVDTLRVDHEKYQTIFAESEIAEMDITGFKKEPVE